MTHFSHHLTTVRSDKTNHLLTDTSLQFVISFRNYFSICDYGVSNRCDSKESYAPTQCMTTHSHHPITMRSDRINHVLTHTSLNIVMPNIRYLHIDDYKSSRRYDYIESYDPKSHCRSRFEVPKHCGNAALGTKNVRYDP